MGHGTIKKSSFLLCVNCIVSALELELFSLRRRNRIPKEVAESPSLDAFKNYLDVVLKDMI